MISISKNGKYAKNWTCEQYFGRFYALMKRKLRIQVAFEPTRQGKEHLHQAYELVVPVQHRRLHEPESLAVTTESKPSARQRRKAGVTS